MSEEYWARQYIQVLAQRDKYREALENISTHTEHDMSENGVFCRTCHIIDEALGQEGE